VYALYVLRIILQCILKKWFCSGTTTQSKQQDYKRK